MLPRQVASPCAGVPAGAVQNEKATPTSFFPALGCSHKSRGRHVEPTEKSPIKKGSVSYPRVQPIPSPRRPSHVGCVASTEKKNRRTRASRNANGKRSAQSRHEPRDPHPAGRRTRAASRPRLAVRGGQTHENETRARERASERARGWRGDERSEADSDGSVAPPRGTRAGQPCRPLHRWCWISLETTGPGTSRGTRARAGTDDAFGREDVSSCYPRREEETGTR